MVGVELLLIGLVVWWVVDFLEGTRGERLFRGVIFILVAGVLVLNLVVERLPFDRLQYLYKGFPIFVLIVAVAAFQPEIRRALIRIGQPRFLASPSQKLAITMEQIITAVTNLSASKIGSIIVIEKRVALGEFIETGVRITGSSSNPVIIGNNVLIKGVTYIFGSVIEDDLTVVHSILKNMHVEKVKKKNGEIQPIKYIFPHPEGLDSITPIRKNT